jgi:membrane protease YdiL (CAAX protease family)
LRALGFSAAIELSMPNVSKYVATAFEIGLLLAGAFLLWRVALRPAARRQAAPVALARWEVTSAEFLLFLWTMIAGAFVGACVAQVATKFGSFSTDAKNAFATGASQLGAVAGMALFEFFLDRHRTPPLPNRSRHYIAAGAATFVVAMPIVAVVMFAWQGLLRLCHLHVEPQDLIRVFTEADSPALLLGMIGLACIGAPVAEELVFRRGIFRFARTRLPRWAALLVPALLFGASHQNLASLGPLTALGVVYSLAYERTGNIKTTMVAHALFNLNTIVLLYV